MKLTKQQTKAHAQAIALANCGRVLTLAERRHVWENFHPGAEHNVGPAGIFFTTWKAAWELAVVRGNVDGAKTIDFCAGIGVLAGSVLEVQPDTKMACVEINPVFVELGKKIVPEAEWFCLDAFRTSAEWTAGKHFTDMISNPPFGNLPGGGKGEFITLEIGTRITEHGGYFVLSNRGLPYGDESARPYKEHVEKHCPGWTVYRTCVDLLEFGFKETTTKAQLFQLTNDV